jgi:hypothetical protein
MQYKLKIETFNNYIHYYLNDVYIGMLVFNKGELSDFRAIIRKNRLSISEDNIYSVIKTSFYGLLNHYLSERFFIAEEELEILKSKIVSSNDSVLKEVSNMIASNDIGQEK